jgi:nucleoside-diphosphate-sugar epimerase
VRILITGGTGSFGQYMTEHLEQEYQKGTSSHGTTQRPDIIIHVPVEHSGARITENNYVVYALKKIRVISMHKMILIQCPQ